MVKMDTNSKFQKPNSDHQNSNSDNQSMQDSSLHGNDTPGGQDPDFGNGEGSNNNQSPMTNDQMGNSKFQNPNSNEAEIERLQQELENEREAKLRALADYQNLQRRTEERIQHMEFIANAAIVGEVIDVIDDFDRAFNHASENIDLAGFQAIKNKLEQILHRLNVEEIVVEESGDFDPNLHEAITKVETNDKSQDNKIAGLAQKGYLLRKEEGIEVIRPARVLIYKLS